MMKNKRTQITFLYGTVILFSSQVIFGFDEMRIYTGFDDINLQIALSVGIIALFIWLHHLTTIAPYRRFQRFEKTKNKLLEERVNSFINEFQKAGYNFRVNVMLVHRPILSNIEPFNFFFKRKISLLKKHLYTEWTSKNMKHDPDSNLKLSISQGVSGHSYRSERPSFIAINESNINIFNLNTDQKIKTSDIKFISSFPIRELDNALNLKPNIVGIVNIDSLDDHSNQILDNHSLLTLIVKKQQILSEYCSHLY